MGYGLGYAIIVIIETYANIQARRAQQTTIASIMFQKSLERDKTFKMFSASPANNGNHNDEI